jgi:hypothetical protein
MGGWVDGWVGGWVGVKAVLRIAYSNQKLEPRIDMLCIKYYFHLKPFCMTYF